MKVRRKKKEEEESIISDLEMITIRVIK